MSSTFEAIGIVDDKCNNGKSYYLVEWKNTITNNPQAYQSYKNDIKRVRKGKNKYIIKWKKTWMEFHELKSGCDEILGAYLLLKLYNFSK